MQTPLDRRSALGRLLAGTSSLVAAGSASLTPTAHAALPAAGPKATPAAATGLALIITAPGLLQPNAQTKLSASVRGADGALMPVQPTWSTSDAALATVSRAGVLASGPVVVDSAVLVTATLLYQGSSLSTSQYVFISAAASRLSRLEVLGSRSLQSGAQLRLTVLAYYEDASYRSIKPISWTLHSDTSEALSVILAGGIAVDFARGILKLNTIDRQYALDISATYTEAGVTAVGRLDLLATTQASTLTTLTIVSPLGAVLHPGDSVVLKALGVYQDQSLKPVAANWQVDHPALQISGAGVLTVGPLAQDAPALVSASFTEAGITTMAEFAVLLQQAPSTVPLQLEVEATGPRSRYGLSAWVRLGAALPPARIGQGSGLGLRTTAPNTGYKLYVVAMLPGTAEQSSVYVLNRSREWQALSFPLAEYLSGVVESRDYLVDIFEQIDSRLIAGTAIYIGYGTSDTEMLAQGRYRLLQVL